MTRTLRGLALALLGLAAPASAAEPEEAVAATVAGNFPRAEEVGRALLAEGVVNGDVYYNLGIALYQQERLPEAVLAWRRAAVLAPRDGDIGANLDRARRQLRDRLDPPEPGGALFWRHSLSPGEQTWGAALLLGLVGALGLAGRLRPGLPLGIPALLAGVPGLLLALGAGVSWRELARQPGAVVLAEGVEVRSTGEQGVLLFELHAGAEVQRLALVGEMAQIALGDGRRGWVPAAALGVVDPRAPLPGSP